MTLIPATKRGWRDSRLTSEEVMYKLSLTSAWGARGITVKADRLFQYYVYIPIDVACWGYSCVNWDWASNYDFLFYPRCEKSIWLNFPTED